MYTIIFKLILIVLLFIISYVLSNIVFNRPKNKLLEMEEYFIIFLINVIALFMTFYIILSPIPN